MQSQKNSWDFCTLLPKGHFLRVSSLNSFWHTTLGCKSNTPIITFSLLFSTWTIRYNLRLFLKYMSDPFGIQLSADIQFMFEVFSHLLFSTTIQLLKMRQWKVSFFTWQVPATHQWVSALHLPYPQKRCCQRIWGSLSIYSPKLRLVELAIITGIFTELLIIGFSFLDLQQQITKIFNALTVHQFTIFHSGGKKSKPKVSKDPHMLWRI